jgi:hypothetical protein
MISENKNATLSERHQKLFNDTLITIETPTSGTVWGRQTCMQGIPQDLNVQGIFKNMCTI